MENAENQARKVWGKKEGGERAMGGVLSKGKKVPAVANVRKRHRPLVYKERGVLMKHRRKGKDSWPFTVRTLLRLPGEVGSVGQ